MYGEVMIPRADGTQEPTPLLANAATPRRYKQIFHEDLLTLFANAESEENGHRRYNIDFIAELAFVMAMQAKAKEDDTVKLEKLNEDKLLDWLEQYDGLAIENTSQEILDVYLGNTKTESKSKKNRGARTAD